MHWGEGGGGCSGTRCTAWLVPRIEIECSSCDLFLDQCIWTCHNAFPSLMSVNHKIDIQILAAKLVFQRFVFRFRKQTTSATFPKTVAAPRVFRLPVPTEAGVRAAVRGALHHIPPGGQWLCLWRSLGMRKLWSLPAKARKRRNGPRVAGACSTEILKPLS